MTEHPIEEFWEEFLGSLAPNSPMQGKTYTAESYGDKPELADHLGELIITGTKTATCSTLSEWEAEGTAIPEAGLITIVLDGRGEPLCIIETIDVKIIPFNEVGSEFAYAEGEGDRSLKYWREAHLNYFSRSLAVISRKPALDMPLVCERFRVIFKSSAE